MSVELLYAFNPNCTSNLYLVPMWARYLHEEAVERHHDEGGAIELDIACLAVAVRSRVVAEVIAERAGFDANYRMYDGEPGAVRLLHIYPSWGRDCMISEANSMN